LAVSADQRNEYELVLMLDPESPDERRDEIATNARQRIEEKGALTAEGAWGMRKLAYEIRQRTEADYRFFRFATESPLLDELDHNLKITDGVLRFRIFKVDPRSPVIEPPPPMALASSAPSRGPGGPRRGGPGGPPPAAEAPAPPAEVPAPAAEAPAPAAEPVTAAAPEEPPPAAAAEEPAAPAAEEPAAPAAEEPAAPPAEAPEEPQAPAEE
jgi:small subunit ribosomal protein S6